MKRHIGPGWLLATPAHYPPRILTAGQSPALYLAFCGITMLQFVWVATRQCRRRAACARLRPSSLYVRSDLSSTCLFIKVERYLMASPIEMSLHAQG